MIPAKILAANTLSSGDAQPFHTCMRPVVQRQNGEVTFMNRRQAIKATFAAATAAAMLPERSLFAQDLLGSQPTPTGEHAVPESRHWVGHKLGREGQPAAHPGGRPGVSTRAPAPVQ
jgi:hypothetical protein